MAISAFDYYKDFSAETAGDFVDADFTVYNGALDIVSGLPSGNALSNDPADGTNVLRVGYTAQTHGEGVSVGVIRAYPNDGSDSTIALTVGSSGAGYNFSSTLGTETCYASRWLGSSVLIYRIVSGSVTNVSELATGGVAPANGDEYVLRVTNNTSSILVEALVNDSVVQTFTDSSPITFSGGVASLSFKGLTNLNSASYGFGVDGFAASGPSISSNTTSAYPGQSVTVSGSGFGATQGSLTVGGVAQTITAWSDTSISFTTVLGTNSYGTGKTLELTTDSSETDTATIELVADTAGGFGVVTMSSPNTTDDSSVAFNATPTVVTGDQFEWEDFNALGNLVIGSDGFVESVDTEGTFRGRFWDATDSTWGSVQNFTATVPDEIGPVTTSVNVPQAGTYAIGDTLSFTANWDENSNVTGTPRLPLTFASGTRYADYASGTGTTALVFSYTVQEGDEDTDGIAVNTIELNGGTIQDGNSNAATLTLNGVENTEGIIVDGIRPAISVGNTTTSDTTPTVSGSAGDATSLTLVVTGIGTYNPTPSGGSWSQTLPESPLGEYSMTLDGTDAAGNTAAQASGTLNIIEQGAWPYGLGIKPSIPVTWEWGKRHPTTGMRVRLFKRGGQ